LIDAVNNDALAPYAFLAWKAIPDLLYVNPGLLAPIGTALVRHINLLSRLDADIDPSYLYSNSAKLVELANQRIVSDEQSQNPLVRYLARRRSALAESIIHGVQGGGGPANRTWQEIRRDEDLSRAFDIHMINRSSRTIEFGVDADANNVVVDVGGGAGQYTVAALRQLPSHWTAIIVDAYAQTGWFAIRESQKLHDRIQTLVTDGAWSFPSGAGVYLIASVLHNLSDHEASKLLRICAEKCIPTTRVVIIERAWNSDSLRDSSRDLDMHLLYGGRERTDEELETLLETAGLELVSSSTTVDAYRLLVAQRTHK
jgi:hypothetical protein